VPEKKAKRATEARKATKTVKRVSDPSTRSKTVAKKTVARRAAPAKTTEARAAAAAPSAVHRGRRKTKVGRVVSAKMPKTVIVEISRLRKHPLYKKVISVRKRFPAHDANGEVKAGDIVRIQESRPFSATKRWQVIEVLSRTGEAMAAAPEAADIEKQLEERAGVTELLSKPERETPEAEEAQTEGETEE
jgi:small subunit ribosomal protein S17